MEINKTIMTSIKVSIIIPVYNEENTIGVVVEQIRALYPEFEVIVVDDGSNDKTDEVARSAGASVNRHPYNMGNGSAVKTGIRAATGDVLVFMDGDGQHDPNEIPQLIRPIVQDKTDVVIGSRFIDSNSVPEMPLYRRFGARLITKLANWVAKTDVKDAQSGFRAYNRQALEGLSVFENGMGASVEIIREAKKRNLRLLELRRSEQTILSQSLQ